MIKLILTERKRKFVVYSIHVNVKENGITSDF